ncbi:hypothetical protein IQ06DRAFT_31844 [Phaeosphaeriaceae sp. SRC1lsM3a]|nr:hypothetical protein IQ06DRAFT_31844 [Stagonospora sp. SRC1lsM3a]
MCSANRDVQGGRFSVNRDPGCSRRSQTSVRVVFLGPSPHGVPLPLRQACRRRRSFGSGSRLGRVPSNLLLWLPFPMCASAVASCSRGSLEKAHRQSGGRTAKSIVIGCDKVGYSEQMMVAPSQRGPRVSCMRLC